MANEVKEPAFKYKYTTAQDYLAAENAAEQKHEYYNGRVLAMSGASMKHNFITSNLVGSIGAF